MRILPAVLLAVVFVLSACGEKASQKTPVLPSWDELQRALMQRVAKQVSRKTGKSVEDTLMYSRVARRHISPSIEACCVGEPIALLEWSDDGAFGMMLMCNGKGDGRLVYARAIALRWDLVGEDWRQTDRQDPIVTEATIPSTVIFRSAERKEADELLARLPKNGAVFTEAALSWGQFYWFTTWEGETRRTVAVGPLAFDYILGEPAFGPVDKIQKSTQHHAEFAGFIMRLMHGQVRRENPHRQTDVPLPYKEYDRGGPTYVIPD